MRLNGLKFIVGKTQQNRVAHGLPMGHSLGSGLELWFCAHNRSDEAAAFCNMYSL
jgi:hypothetical protein